mmetsp:Transcript_19101/g.40123  ORF Transcript_19101/g.40123 Transcript_19101/m.40123 type:complete len:145 (-) Transcript_19101:17-451(-)
MTRPTELSPKCSSDCVFREDPFGFVVIRTCHGRFPHYGRWVGSKGPNSMTIQTNVLPHGGIFGCLRHDYAEIVLSMGELDDRIDDLVVCGLSKLYPPINPDSFGMYPLFLAMVGNAMVSPNFDRAFDSTNDRRESSKKDQYMPF